MSACCGPCVEHKADALHQQMLHPQHSLRLRCSLALKRLGSVRLLLHRLQCFGAAAEDALRHGLRTGEAELQQFERKVYAVVLQQIQQHANAAVTKAEWQKEQAAQASELEDLLREAERAVRATEEAAEAAESGGRGQQKRQRQTQWQMQDQDAPQPRGKQLLGLLAEQQQEKQNAEKQHDQNHDRQTQRTDGKQLQPLQCQEMQHQRSCRPVAAAVCSGLGQRNFLQSKQRYQAAVPHTGHTNGAGGRRAGATSRPAAEVAASTAAGAAGTAAASVTKTKIVSREVAGGASVSPGRYGRLTRRISARSRGGNEYISSRSTCRNCNSGTDCDNGSNRVSNSNCQGSAVNGKSSRSSPMRGISSSNRPGNKEASQLGNFTSYTNRSRNQKNTKSNGGAHTSCNGSGIRRDQSGGLTDRGSSRINAERDSRSSDSSNSICDNRLENMQSKCNKGVSGSNSSSKASDDNSTRSSRTSNNASNITGGGPKPYSRKNKDTGNSICSGCDKGRNGSANVLSVLRALRYKEADTSSLSCASKSEMESKLPINAAATRDTANPAVGLAAASEERTGKARYTAVSINIVEQILAQIEPPSNIRRLGQLKNALRYPREQRFQQRHYFRQQHRQLQPQRQLPRIPKQRQRGSRVFIQQSTPTCEIYSSASDASPSRAAARRCGVEERERGREEAGEEQAATAMLSEADEREQHQEQRHLLRTLQFLSVLRIWAPKAGRLAASLHAQHSCTPEPSPKKQEREMAKDSAREGGKGARTAQETTAQDEQRNKASLTKQRDVHHQQQHNLPERQEDVGDCYASASGLLCYLLRSSSSREGLSGCSTHASSTAASRPTAAASITAELGPGIEIKGDTCKIRVCPSGITDAWIGKTSSVTKSAPATATEEGGAATAASTYTKRARTLFALWALIRWLTQMHCSVGKVVFGSSCTRTTHPIVRSHLQHVFSLACLKKRPKPTLSSGGGEAQRNGGGFTGSFFSGDPSSCVPMLLLPLVRELAAGALTSRFTYTWFLAAYESGQVTPASAKHEHQQRQRQSRQELTHNLAFEHHAFVVGEDHDYRCAESKESETRGEEESVADEGCDVQRAEQQRAKEMRFLTFVLTNLSISVESYNRAPGRAEQQRNSRRQLMRETEVPQSAQRSENNYTGSSARRNSASVGECIPAPLNTSSSTGTSRCRGLVGCGPPGALKKLIAENDKKNADSVYIPSRAQSEAHNRQQRCSCTALWSGALSGRRVLPNVTMVPTRIPASVTSAYSIRSSALAHAPLREDGLFWNAEKSALLTRIHELQWIYIHSLLLQRFKAVLTIMKITTEEIVHLQRRPDALVPRPRSDNSSEARSVAQTRVNLPLLIQKTRYQQQQEQQVQSDNGIGVSAITLKEDMIHQALQAFASLYRAIEFVVNSRDKKGLCGVWKITSPADNEM